MEVDMQIAYLREHKELLQRERDEAMRLIIYFIKEAGGKIKIDKNKLEAVKLGDYSITYYNDTSNDYLELQPTKNRKQKKREGA